MTDGPSASDAEARGLQAAARGDREAFMRLLSPHDDGLRSLAFRLLDDPDEMDDVLQDVYAKAFINLSTFRREAAVGTWLYRIAYTTCIDRLRRRRRETALDAALAGAPRVGVADPADVFAVRDDVARALASLPPEHRAAVLLISNTNETKQGGQGHEVNLWKLQNVCRTPSCKRPIPSSAAGAPTQATRRRAPGSSISRP